MEINSKLSQLISQIADKLSDQAWFQQIKAKWDELDAQSKTYLRLAVLGAVALFAIVLVFSAMWNVRSLRNEFSDKTELIALLQRAGDEMRQIRNSLPPGAGIGGGGGQAMPWPAYLEAAGLNAGVEKASLTVKPQEGAASTPPPSKKGSKDMAATELAKEELFEVQLKHVDIKQVVRYTLGLENGAKAVKVRNLMIDTGADLDGYLNATLAVSTFTVKE